MSDETKYIWVRFRTKHSSGYGYWDYAEFAYTGNADAEYLQECLEQLNNEHTTDSEHWRGVEGDFVDHPPISTLKDSREDARERAKELLAEVERLDSLIATVKPQYVVLTASANRGPNVYLPDPQSCGAVRSQNRLYV